MSLCVIDDHGVKRKVVAVYKGSEDGKPIKLEEGTPEYEAAVNLAVLRGVFQEVLI